MANGKREFEIKINGITESIEDVTKLVDVLGKVGNTEAAVAVEVEKSNKARKEKKQALTDEEKAQKKLEEIQRKAAVAESDLNKQIIAATRDLREKTRAATLDVQAQNASTNSIEGMRAELNKLRNDWTKTDVGSELFEELTAQVAELTAKLKGAEAATGDFRRNVGNYGSALDGLSESSQNAEDHIKGFGGSVEKTTQLGSGLAQTLMLGAGVTGLFGAESGDSAKQVAYLQKIIGLLSIAQAINTGLLKNDMVVKKAASIVDGIRIIQTKALTKAKELETKQTIYATIAQKAFNIVASANPYVLLAVAILSVVGAIGAYSISSKNATEDTKKYVSAVDGMRFRTQEAADAHDELIRKLRDIRIEIDLASGKISEYGAAWVRVSNEAQDAVEDLRKKTIKELDELDKNYDSFSNKLGFYFSNYFNTNVKAVTPWGLSDDPEYLKQRANERKSILERASEEENGIYKTQNEREEELVAKHNAKVYEQNEQARIDNLSGLNKELKQIEFNRSKALKQAELDNETSQKAIAAGRKASLVDISVINANFDKQEKEARANAGKAAISKQKEISDKQKEASSIELELMRQAEDAKTELVINGFDQREEQVRLKYSRQKKDLEKRLKEDKKLTEVGRNAITEIINSIAERETNDLKKINEERVKDNEAKLTEQKELWDKIRAYNAQQSDKELASLERFITDTQQRIGDIEVRDKTGLQLIDVEATRRNLNETDKALTEYVSKIQQAQEKIRALHEANLKNLKEGTPEYENELNRYADAEYALNKKLADANKAKEENTKQTTNLMLSYWQDFFSKVSEQIAGGMEGVTAVFDAINSIYQSQLDELNEKYDEISERYDEVDKKREESAERIKDFEQQIQEAQGGTALALREQLAREMQAKAELDQEEKRLAKEKEKREAEIAKKEKQMKKTQLVQDIAGAGANVAYGITKALTLIWPLSTIVAALVAASGAVQIGVMSRNLAKMEDGGLLAGPSHASGGMRIQGTNIEVEGGEYVVNKRSAARNQQLIEYINNSTETVTAKDIANLQGIPVGNYGSTPDVQVRDTYTTEDKIIEAIKGINFRPVVSVKDINDVQKNVVDVTDIAGID